MSCMCALALLYCHVSGPYWLLVNSNTKYLELPHFIQMMESKLQTLSVSVEDLFSLNCKGVSAGKFHSAENLSSILDLCQDQLASVKQIVQICLLKMLEVTRQQLADFLAGGVYGGEVEDSIRECLQHCPITNLSGEHAFGDLDYDLNQRHHTSLHKRATRHMQKWNNDAFWLEKKKKDRGDILQLARKKKEHLRSKFKRQEEIVKLKTKERLLHNHQQKLEKERNQAERKQKIVDKVLKDGGVCKTKNDINKLQTIDSIKAQLQYHKIVLGTKGIIVSGDRDHLRLRLETYLDTGEILKRVDSSPPKKRRKMDNASEGSSSEESGVEIKENEENERMQETFTFKGKRQGLWLAVYYDDSPHIGQVLEIVDDDNASVKFLTSTKLSVPRMFLSGLEWMTLPMFMLTLSSSGTWKFF